MYKLQLKAIDAINAMLEVIDTEPLPFMVTTMADFFQLSGSTGEKKKAEVLLLNYDSIAV